MSPSGTMSSCSCSRSNVTSAAHHRPSVILINYRTKTWIQCSARRLIVKARNWWQRLQQERGPMVSTIAEQEGVNHSYVTRVLRLAFLSPQIVEAIIASFLPDAVRDLQALLLEKSFACFHNQPATRSENSAS